MLFDRLGRKKEDCVSLPYVLSISESCLTCGLRSEGFFCSLPRPALEAFELIKFAASYPGGAVVFSEGQTPRGIFVLCQGRAKLSTSREDGRKMILRIAKPGEILGLHAVVTGEAHEMTVETMQPCQLNFVKTPDFLEFMKEHSAAFLNAAKRLSHDFKAAQGLIRSIGLSRSTAERLARLLLESSEEARGGDGASRVTLALTHEEISQLIGTSREAVTRTLSDFKKKGVAELKGATLIIRDRAGLEELVPS